MQNSVRAALENILNILHFNKAILMSKYSFRFLAHMHIDVDI